MISLKGVSKTYSTGRVDVHALRNVSLDIGAGEFVSIIGPSGSGKSTLLHIMGFLDRPDSGEYRLLGKDVTKLQDDELSALRKGVFGINPSGYFGDKAHREQYFPPSSDNGITGFCDTAVNERYGISDLKYRDITPPEDFSSLCNDVK